MRTGRSASFARALAWSYLGALAVLVAVLRFVGEDSWLVTALIYLPRWLFALPLALTLPAVVYAGPRGMLATQAASLLLVLFPLMGLEVHPFAPARDPGAPTVRLLSFNVYFGRAGCDTIVSEIAAHDPDIVVLQASGRHCERALAARFPSFRVEAAGEFVLGSRFPVRDVLRPEDLKGPREIQPAFMRYTLETPLGAIDLYSIHPYSPRHAFEAARGDGLRTQILEQIDEPHPPVGRAEIEANTSDRERQVAAIARAAAGSTNPVVIAGDTNLPALSRLYARYLAAGGWKDGFASVGSGLGYTFPTRWKFDLGPWMRIDRILVGRGLRFLRFEVGGKGASDHCPVIAELAAER